MASAAKPKVGETIYSILNDTDGRYERLFDASVELIFDAYTKPEHISKWLLGPEGWTMPVCEMDLRAGGAWRWGWAKASGEAMEMTGKILEITPPHRLVMTERWGPEWPETTNEITFTRVGNQTLVSCITRWKDKQQRDAALGTGMTKGMDVSFDRLDTLVRTLR